MGAVLELVKWAGLCEEACLDSKVAGHGIGSKDEISEVLK